MAEDAKRSRSLNFTEAEDHALLSAYADNRETLQSKLKTNVTNRIKKNAWENVLQSVNAVARVTRTSQQIKDRWVTLKRTGTAQLRARKYPPTGGGKPPEMPNLELIEIILGEKTFLIDGICGEGPYDSGDIDIVEPPPKKGK